MKLANMKPLPDSITIGEKYRPAMEIEDQAEADEYFKILVEHTMRIGNTSYEDAAKIERESLGYYAGYYDNDTRLKVERLYNCEHPIYGKATDKQMSTEEAFQKTVEYWKKKSSTPSEEAAKPLDAPPKIE